MRSKKAKSGEERYLIRTVERALSILKIFIENDSAGEFNLAEISRITGLSESTAYRLLITLKFDGFVQQDSSNGKYRLGTSALALGDAFLKHNNLYQKAKSSLISLRDNTGETVHLAVLEGHEVVYLDKLAGLHPIGLMSSRIGGRSPVYCTGLGKALIAHLPESELNAIIEQSNFIKYTPNTNTFPNALIEELKKVREQGFAVDKEEHNRGVACIAAPIFDHTGTVAALSVSGPSERIQQALEDHHTVSLVKETARELSVQMGGNLMNFAESSR